MPQDQSIKIIDSHTGGEPTRIVIAGIPDLGGGSIADQSNVFRTQHDWLRSSVANEPRGHDAMVGALLLPPSEPDCLCGVIFFNNVSTLNMCIHGTIGLGVTLAHMGKISAGAHKIDTPVGVITLNLHEDQRVSVNNVPSYRLAKDVAVEVPGYGSITGDIAWGGNWFFLINEQGPAVRFENIAALTHFTSAVKQALTDQGITGANGMEIDHIESFGPPSDPALADSKNFVLCPGNAYDRSPCGTGTSAKLACLYADGKLLPGQTWRQAGILDSVFEGQIAPLHEQHCIPTVSGRAWIIGESTYHFSPDDPFRHGIISPSV
jgi:4-hydroxyproline epimerase